MAKPPQRIRSDFDRSSSSKSHSNNIPAVNELKRKAVHTPFPPRSPAPPSNKRQRTSRNTTSHSLSNSSRIESTVFKGASSLNGRNAQNGSFEFKRASISHGTNTPKRSKRSRSPKEMTNGSADPSGKGLKMNENSEIKSDDSNNLSINSTVEADFIPLDDFPDVDKSIEESFRQFEDDLIDGPEKKKRKFHPVSDNHDDTDQFPWMRRLKQSAKRLSVANQLTQEILDFAAYVSPRRHEVSCRLEIINSVRKAVNQRWPNRKFRTHVFGSVATNLYLPEADIDLVVTSETGSFITSKSSLYQLAGYLRQEGIASTVTVIAKARVPIIKFRDAKYNVSVDISFDQLTGVAAVKTIEDWLKQYPAMRPLALVIKQFIAKRRLNDVHTGGLGGYSLLCMLEAFLSTHPRVSSRSIVPEENLGVLLIEFFELYGTNFNYEDLIIRPAADRRIARKTSFKSISFDAKTAMPVRLVIQDPNDEENNISRGTFNLRGIRRAFKGAFNLLTAKCYDLDKKKNSDDLKSILGSIITVADSTRSFEDLLYPIAKFNDRSKGVSQPGVSQPGVSQSIDGESKAVEERADDFLRSIYVLHEDDKDNSEGSDVSEKVETTEQVDEKTNNKKTNEKANDSKISDETIEKTTEKTVEKASDKVTSSTANGTEKKEPDDSQRVENDVQPEETVDIDDNDIEDSKIQQVSVDKAKRRYYWLSKAIVI